MRGMAWLASVMTVTVLAGAAVEARERGRRRTREPEESLYDQLVRECKLTAEQQAKAKAKIKAHDDALAAWDKANAEKMTAAEAAGKEARSGQDADAKKKATTELRTLRKAREEAGAEAAAAVLTVLTPEQKTAWGAYQLYRSIAGRYRRAELTEEQLAKVKAACAFAAKDLAEIDDSDSKAKKARGAVSQKLQWAINALVLTPEQRKTLAAGRGGRGKNR